MQLARLRDLVTSDLDCPTCGGRARIEGTPSEEDEYGEVSCRRCDEVFEVELAPLRAERTRELSTLGDADISWMWRYVAAQRALLSALAARVPVRTDLGLLYVEGQPEKTARNPLTGGPMTMRGRSVPRLEPDAKLVQAVLAEPRFPVERADAEGSLEDPVGVWTPDEDVVAFGGRRFPDARAALDASVLVELAREELAECDRTELTPVVVLKKFFARSEFASGNLLVAALDPGIHAILNGEAGDMTVDSFLDGWLRPPSVRSKSLV